MATALILSKPNQCVRAAEGDELPPPAAVARLMLINPDGTNLRELSEFADRNAGSPQWSPDGKLLAYGGLDDAEFGQLAPLANLRVLYLTGNEVTGASASAMQSLPALQELYVRWTGLTEEEANRLRQSMPNCRVYHHRLK